MTYPFMCECRDKRCGETIRLATSVYDELSLRGTIVTAGCARRDGNAVLEDFGEFALVATARAALLATRVDRDGFGY